MNSNCPLTFDKISAILDEVALLLELSGENPFKVRAFSNAARLVSLQSGSLEDFLKQVLSGQVSGFGPQLQTSLKQLIETGNMDLLQELKAQLPAGLIEMTQIPGIGSKKARTLQQVLGIDSIAKLKKACELHQVAEVKGFGEKTEAKLLQAISQFEKYQGQILLSEGLEISSWLIPLLKNFGGCSRAEPVGDLRRAQYTLSKLSILVETEDPQKILAALNADDRLGDVIQQANQISAEVLAHKIKLEISITEANQFYRDLALFTGSDQYVVHLISHARSLGVGIESNSKELKKIQGLSSETELFQQLDLPYQPPELRENWNNARDEYNALVELKDLKGILHVHTTYSDGAHTLREMAEAARALGYQYLGVSDHSQSAGYANGMKADTVRRQQEEIDQLNLILKPFKIFKGIESDILVGGDLDYPDSVLETFDFVIASIHSRFSLDREAMTERVVRAISNPYTTILGHPTGRLLLRREAYELDMIAVIEAAAKYKVSVEINSNPQRLDLDWKLHQTAKKARVMMPISPDAHSIQALSDVTVGVLQARKGALGSSDILNCMNCAEIERAFA